MSEAILIAITLGLVQAAKQAGNPPKWIISVSSIVLGDVMFLLVNGFSPLNVVAGLVVGLSAIGVYSTAKNAIVK